MRLCYLLGSYVESVEGWNPAPSDYSITVFKLDNSVDKLLKGGFVVTTETLHCYLLAKLIQLSKLVAAIFLFVWFLAN